jgi:hypothetical protein
MRLSSSGTSRCCGPQYSQLYEIVQWSNFLDPRQIRALRHHRKAITCFETDGQLNRTISSKPIGWLSSTTSCIGWECLKWNRHRYQFARSRACVRRLRQRPQPVGAENEQLHTDSRQRDPWAASGAQLEREQWLSLSLWIMPTEMLFMLYESSGHFAGLMRLYSRLLRLTHGY